MSLQDQNAALAEMMLRWKAADGFRWATGRHEMFYPDLSRRSSWVSAIFISPHSLN